MKKLILFTALLSVLCMSAGCNVHISKVEKDSNEISETTDIPEETTEITTDVSDSTDNNSDDSEYSISLTGKGVDILLNNEVVQTIEGNFKSRINKIIRYDESDDSLEKYIQMMDMDSDGFMDLFIATERKGENLYGLYYHFNQDTGLFEEWDLFNEIGYLMYPSAANKCIMLHLTYDSGYESYQYELNNNKLEVIHYYKKYDDEKIHKRECRRVGNEKTGVKAVDILYELNADEKKLYITDNIINVENIIDMSFIEGKSYDVVKDTFDRITFRDYDFDGYDDLVIPEGTENKGIFYRFNPESKDFEKWDELNEIGILFGVNISNQLFYYENGNTIYCVWENGSLKPVKFVEKIFNSKEYVLERTYEFDENGEKVLIETSYKTQSLSDATPHSLSPETDFKVNGKNVDLIEEGKVIQTLECDYTPDKTKIEMYDFDFDGYEDLFISMENGALYAQGTYFHYNVDTNLYEKWDELNEKVGREVTIDNENKRLYWVNRSTMEKHIYEWKYKKLKYKEHIILKQDENGIWFETYSIKSGKDVFEKREKDIYDEDNKLVGRFNPDDIYFKVNDTGLDVMILKGDEPLQHIDGDFTGYASKQQFAPEYYIKENVRDFDFDGYKDLFIPIENENTTLKGIYYRFNPVTFQFDYWEELNNTGGYLFAPINTNGQTANNLYEENSLVYYIVGDDSNTTYVYKWEGDRLYCYERIERNFGSEIVTVNTYSIDINGTETLTDSKQMSRRQTINDNYENFTNNHDFSVTENGIDILINGKTVQTIEGDFLEEYSRYSDIGVAPEKFITYTDFNFDGYKDLFIPDLLGRPNIPGHYYKFNPRTSKFEGWEELDTVGQLMSVKDKTLVHNAVGSAVYHKTTVYKWVNDEIEPVSRSLMYEKKGKIYLDNYEYDENGNETLIKSEEYTGG
ncbi:MAG: hypothetical protein K2G63_05585 [Oscillospiraceae bacterium]|nr:hypothetical protein [Oscillospiraceae bacterium]